MSREDLPSIDDYIVDLNDLPSVEDYLTEEVKTELPSVEDYIEEEEIEEAVQTIEDAEGNTFAEVKDIIPPFPELIRLINDVRNDIPDIPEIKYYDKELENLTEQINQVRDEIPEVPEVRYYEAEIEAICEQIDLVKQVIEKNAADIPEIKYYDEQISVLEQRLEQVNQNIEELPEPKYYEEDIQSIRIAIQEVQDQIPTFPKWVNEVNEVPDFSWIGKTFSVIDDDFVKVHDAVEGLRGKVEYDLDRIEEHFDKKEFETRTEFNELRESINTRFDTEKEKIWKEIKETSMRMWGHHKEFKDDDRKLKKQLLGEYNLLKQTLKKDLKEVNKESVKTDELLLGYFNDLKKEISELPEVKYYDEQINDVRDEFKDGLRSLKIIVEEIRGKQEVLKEEINNRPIQPDPGESNIDPLTPMDQNFATHEDLAKHYKLFINRIQQQLYTIGGGGAGFIKDLDDVSFDTGIGTDKLLIYNGSKWVGIASTALTGSSTLNEVLGGGNISGIGMSVGIVTTTELHVGVDTGFFTEELVVNGDARITGILTVGRSSITINGTDDIVTVGTGITFNAATNEIIVGGNKVADNTGNANYSGVVTATAFHGAIKIDESEDDDVAYNVIFTDTTGGGDPTNSHHALQIDDGGLTFNPGTNTVFSVNALHSGNIGLGAYLYHSGDVDTFVGFPIADTITLRTDGVDRIRVTSSGNVGINSDTPSATLDVDGNAKVSGSVTAGSIVADSATFSGSISVGGTITYDDVTYLDSIGIATARSGLEIGAGSITTLQFVGSATATTSSTSQTNIDTFTASEFRSGQYQIQVTKGSAYHITTLNLVHDGTNVFLSEFGTIKTTSDSLASFDADINSGNVRVRATPSSSDSTVFKISKTLIKV